MKALSESQKEQLPEECPPELALKRLTELTSAAAFYQKTLNAMEEYVGKLEEEEAKLDQELREVEAEWKELKEEAEEEVGEEEEQQMVSWVEKVQQARGLPQDKIGSLVSMQWQGGVEEEICLSCYGGLEGGVEVTYLPCCHLFHRGCIQNHLRLNRFCPACQEVVEL